LCGSLVFVAEKSVLKRLKMRRYGVSCTICPRYHRYRAIISRGFVTITHGVTSSHPVNGATPRTLDVGNI
jgi:hypothetical protein